jgi:Response regulators consisting of a CheY-like receiver domain and a winged-helix DNA-binding domain
MAIADVSLNKKVLLVEDARETQLIVKAALSDICQLTVVETIAEGRKEISTGSYALLVLDVKLPDGNGFEFCKNLRETDRFIDLPIVMLTGESETARKVHGFEIGADDYVTKPFDAQEFRARISRKLRRGNKVGFTKDGYRVDYNSHRIFEQMDNAEEQALSLTPLEFKLFAHFLQNEGTIFTREELLELFWGGDIHVSKHTVDTHISSLRKKIGNTGAFLRSVFKKGYCLYPRPARKAQ